MQVEGNSSPIHLNPPVLVLSTCTVLLGLILICTAGSRGRLTLPTITNSPPEMAAVVINISARAFPPHVITQAIVTATARMSFATKAESPSLSSAHLNFVNATVVVPFNLVQICSGTVLSGAALASRAMAGIDRGHTQSAKSQTCQRPSWSRAGALLCPTPGAALRSPRADAVIGS
jgi:hypothetical protein